MSDADDDNIRRGVKVALAMISGSNYERARVLRCSLPSLARWSQGVATPSYKFLVRIADAAGVELDFIRRGGTP